MYLIICLLFVLCVLKLGRGTKNQSSKFDKKVYIKPIQFHTLHLLLCLNMNIMLMVENSNYSIQIHLDEPVLPSFLWGKLITP
jgi:hypothetical protein